jgi:hypothetical protein
MIPLVLVAGRLPRRFFLGPAFLKLRFSADEW